MISVQHYQILTLECGCADRGVLRQRLHSILVVTITFHDVTALCRACYSRAKEASAATALSSKVVCFQRWSNISSPSLL